MTLRLDPTTSQQLQALSKKFGHSQQQIIQEAVRDYLGRLAKSTKEHLLQRQGSLHRGGMTKSEAETALQVSPQIAPSPPIPKRSPHYQALIDSGFITPAKEPWRPPDRLLPSPPGGILAYLDREDRF